MARAEITEVVLSQSGAAVAGASVQVNVRGGSAATVYVAETGGTTRTNPLTTDASGRIEGWLEHGSYDLVVTRSGFEAYTQSFEAVSGAGSGVPNGGTAGQTLIKQSSTDGDATWGDTAQLSSATPNGVYGSGSAGATGNASDAGHVHPSGVLLPTGNFTPLSSYGNNFGSLTKDREHCIGFDLAPQTIDRLAFWVTTSGDAGAVLRLGIRSGTNAPGAVAWQEAVSTAGGAGAKQTAAMAYAHPGGILWLTWTAQNWTTTAPSFRVQTTPAVLVGFARPWAMASWQTFANIAGPGNLVATQESVSGSLPASFTATNAIGATNIVEFLIKRG